MPAFISNCDSKKMVSHNQSRDEIVNMISKSCFRIPYSSLTTIDLITFLKAHDDIVLESLQQCYTSRKICLECIQ